VIVLSGAELVLPDRILSPGTLVIDGDRISDIRSGRDFGAGAFHGHYIVPGLIDVHVHGVDGVDSLDGLDTLDVLDRKAVPGDGAIAWIAARLPRYGVTGFCPTTIACRPDALGRVLEQIRRARQSQAPRSARVLPAHLESNFINPSYRGAQPAECLRSPREALSGGGAPDFAAAAILREIDRSRLDVGIVTLAPELDGGLDLIAWLSERGHRVSLGHSGASYGQALDAIAAGARRATHLFNRMPPFHHRSPGLAGAILQTAEVAAEVICDGFHVHPAVVRTAIAAKGPSRIMAITDGTAASGLPAGARATLGGQPLSVGESAAFLADGTLAGSVMTMDRVLRTLVSQMDIPLVDAVTMCATTPARELGLAGYGVVAPGAIADLVVLDAQLSVVQTYVGGRLAYSRNTGAPASV
jgi:N-acetylglucosamine-6-phosphate deacetylase